MCETSQGSVTPLHHRAQSRLRKLNYVALYMQSFAGESESPVSGAPLGTMLPPQAPIKVGKRWLAHVAPGPRRCCPKMPFFGQNRPKRVFCVVIHFCSFVCKGPSFGMRAATKKNPAPPERVF